MKEIPILFNTEMVKAILSGRKTQTRRIVKLPKDYDGNENTIYDNDPFGLKYTTKEGTVKRLRPPYRAGDILWVRETWIYDGVNYIYKADTEDMPFRWKPSIFMPKEACRIKLEVIGWEVERLTEISEEDAIAEGIERIGKTYKHYNPKAYFTSKALKESIPTKTTAKGSFKTLWESAYGYGSFDKNPFVWVIKFKKL
jgi:hypothetical protein